MVTVETKSAPDKTATAAVSQVRQLDNGLQNTDALFDGCRGKTPYFETAASAETLAVISWPKPQQALQCTLLKACYHFTQHIKVSDQQELQASALQLSTLL